jgi:hypothetical protein
MSNYLKLIDGSKARLLPPSEASSYHDRREISQSGLKAFMKNPSLFYRRYIKTPPDPQPAPSAALQFGKDIEEFLFKERVPRNAVLIPPEVLGTNGAKRNLAGQTQWTDWKDQQPQGALLLKSDEWDKHVGPLVKVRENLKRHRKAYDMLFGSPCERSVGIVSRHEETGLDTRCELDHYSSRGAIIDLKSTKETRKSGFENEIWKYGYFVQGRWYQNMVFDLTGERVPFFLVAVGNNGDYNVETYRLSAEWLQMGQNVIDRGMRMLADAFRTGNWNTATHNKTPFVEPRSWHRQKVNVWEQEV